MGTLGLFVIAGLAACSSDSADDAGNDSARALIALAGSQPGDVIALRAGDDGTTIEWIDRRAGTIRTVSVAEAGSEPLSVDDIETLATIEVGIEGEQRGLLGHTVIDGVRYAAWTDPDTLHLLVGEVSPTGVERIVWDGGATAGGAVGGHLEASADGQLILGIGQLTDWAKANGSGALVQLDAAGPSDQDPIVLSDGYTNPFAFAVIDGELWVADNAVGNDIERIGRGDLTDRDDLAATGRDPRAPSAVVALPDGNLAVCGFLDGQLLAWQTDDAPRYSTPLGPCLTGAVTLADGTVVTASASPDGAMSLVLLPAS